MAKMTRRLYAIAVELNLLERGNPEDPFHIIVYRITGKEHVSKLNQKEEKAVLKELLSYRETEENPQKISPVHRRKVWALIYELCEADPSGAKPAERLCGAIEKILNTSSFRRDPFRWVKERDADKLIETLKRYIKSAERKAKNGHK